MKVTIRRAKPEDARGIYDAHMRSIQQICAKDYSAQQIGAWGHCPFKPGHWEAVMGRDCVWVVEAKNEVRGFCHLAQTEIEGLYLAPEVTGQGAGKRLVQLAMAEVVAEHLGSATRARAAATLSLTLTSTRTALTFYESQGFTKVGPEKTISMGGVPIECQAMELTIRVQ